MLEQRSDSSADSHANEPLTQLPAPSRTTHPPSPAALTQLHLRQLRQIWHYRQIHLNSTPDHTHQLSTIVKKWTVEIQQKHTVTQHLAAIQFHLTMHHSSNTVHPFTSRRLPFTCCSLKNQPPGRATIKRDNLSEAVLGLHSRLPRAVCSARLGNGNDRESSSRRVLFPAPAASLRHWLPDWLPMHSLTGHDTVNFFYPIPSIPLLVPIRSCPSPRKHFWSS